MEIIAETNPSRVPCYSPFRYPGGKSWFVPAARTWLRETAPRELVGLFAGGAQVELAAGIEGLVDKVTLVELDAAVCAVWRAILEDGPEVAAHLRSAHDSPLDVTDPRMAALVRNRTAFGGVLAAGAGVQRSHNGRPVRWYPETIARRIEAIWQHRHRFELVEGDAFDVLPTVSAGAAVFADPPYVKAGARLYNHGTLDHERLIAELADHPGPLVITYDDCDLVRTAAERSGLDVATVAAGLRNRAGARHELVLGRLGWAGRQAVQPSLFDAA